MKICNMKNFFVLVLLALIVGCSEKLPDNFPNKLTNFTIELLYEGKPVEGASVSLIVDDTTKGYLVSAFTGNNGVAQLETSVNAFSKTGVPAGKYKAVISHIPKTSIELTQQEVSTLGNDELEKRENEINKERAKLPHPVPESWKDLTATPIKIVVPENGGKITIEITNPKTFEQ
jgi:hypothetical protein